MLTNMAVGLGVLLLVWMAASPLESLSWWARGGAERGWQFDDVDQTAAAKSLPGRHYVVYLSGIAAIDDDYLPDEEIRFLDLLRQHLPDHVIITDVFPYSVENRGLTAARPMAWLWGRVTKMRMLRPDSWLPFLINVRNAIQLLVSADRRYGPTFNMGTAQQILRSLARHGYDRASGETVTLIGWSGGGQIALGASWYLDAVGVPITIISLGGMLSDDVGLDKVKHVWHLYGTKDKLQALGGVIFPGRWPTARTSPWAKAQREDRIDMIPIGPFHHSFNEHYFDFTRTMPDGRLYAEVTLDAFVSLLADGRAPVPYRKSA